MTDAGVSDDTLLAGMGVGDERAGVAFVRRYQRRVYGLALSMVGDPVLAQDIAQEAFLRAWRHALVFDRRRASVGTWILTITRNLAVDSLRLRRPVVTDPSDLMWVNLASRGPGPEEHAESSDTRASASWLPSGLCHPSRAERSCWRRSTATRRQRSARSNRSPSAPPKRGSGEGL
jgi:DNA-directed RNA polymerase specialized sigma24 family protein